MIKIISNEFNFKDNTFKKVNRNIEKNASVFISKFIKNIKPEGGRTKFHVLFLGAGEYYSSNKNGDWFGEDDLLKSYKTFERFGKVYRHHVNKDPKNNFGDIELTVYNPDMHRVEGIISLINDKTSDILSKYEAGNDIPVSMAAKLKYDICSICGHRSKSFSEYCDHLKYEMNNIYPDGRKVYAINPNPIFFDISLVWRPADPTAYFLNKVASNGIKNLSAFWGDMYYNNIEKKSELVEKRALISKLADLEKHIEGILAGEVKDDKLLPLINNPISLRDFPYHIIEKLKSIPFGNMLSSLANYNIMLKPNEFANIIGMDNCEDLGKFLPGSFQRLLNRDDNMLGFNFGLDSKPLPIFNIIKGFTDRAITPENIYRHIKIINFEKKPKLRIYSAPGMKGYSYSSGKGRIIIKESQIKGTNLADMYNLYKLAFCLRAKNKESYLYSVISNYVN